MSTVDLDICGSILSVSGLNPFTLVRTGDLHAAVQKAVAGRKQKDARHKEGVYASSAAHSSKDRHGHGEHVRGGDRHRHDSHKPADSTRQNGHRHHSDRSRDSSRDSSKDSSRDSSRDRDRPRSESRHRSNWDGAGTPMIKRDEDEWEMTPSRSGRATPTPSRGATGRSQWDYMASPAPSPVRAGTGKSMNSHYAYGRIPHACYLESSSACHTQHLHAAMHMPSPLQFRDSSPLLTGHIQ